MIRRFTNSGAYTEAFFVAEGMALCQCKELFLEACSPAEHPCCFLVVYFLVA